MNGNPDIMIEESTTDHLSIGARMRESGVILTRYERHKDQTALFGFWVYLMTDFVLFAGLFAVFAVLRSGMVGVPQSLTISGPFVLTETLMLLTSSYICGMSLLAARAKRKQMTVTLLGLAALLGAVFVGMECTEFVRLAATGSGPQASGFLSAYFTLVGTHGLHITLGIIWAVALIISILRRGLTRSNKRKLVLWSLFWHFLDLVWIFIFTIVYLFGL